MIPKIIHYIWFGGKPFPSKVQECIDSWHKYCQRQMRDSFHQLDEELIFSNHKTKKRDYASKTLSYPLEAGETTAYDKIMSTLYDEENRRKIEWAVGSIVNGDSKKIQKFLVLYGAPGTGKSTVLNIIQQMVYIQSMLMIFMSL